MLHHYAKDLLKINTISLKILSVYCVISCFAFQITKLKIDSNPFAKGFRDSSRLTDMERYATDFFALLYRGGPLIRGRYFAKKAQKCLRRHKFCPC